MILTNYFTSLFGSKPKNLHLQGLTPVNLPPNHLWQQMCASENLQTAFDWLCQQTTESNHNSDVWDYRRDWTTRKPELRQQLLNGNFQFATVRIVEIENEQGQLERREVRGAEDKLVIRAVTQVLQPVLPIHPTCTHVKGHGGLKPAVRDTQEYLAAHPDSFVMKSDVKGYYAHIDHEIIAEQLHYCLPFEPEMTRLVWLFLRRTTEFGGNYVDVQRGLPLAASISPLLGGLYLTPMDALFEAEEGIFYRRYMDDWIIIQEKRHGLGKSVKKVYSVLDALGMQTHPVKTFIGKGNKGFDFLGFAICPTGLTVSDAALSRRDTKIATLFEQGASKRRIGLYLARWLGWASITAAAAWHGLAFAACPAVSPNSDWCACSPPSLACRNGPTADSAVAILGTPPNWSWNSWGAFCMNNTSIWATGATAWEPVPTSGSRHLTTSSNLTFRNNITGDLYSCKFDTASGFSAPNGAPTDPSAPTPAAAPTPSPTASSITTKTVPFAGAWAFFWYLLAVGSITSLWRNRNQRK